MQNSPVNFFVVISMIAAMAMFRSIAFADNPKGKTPATQPSPNPDLSAKEVVKTILDALGNNDAADTGIKTTWKFASPQNQKATGPLQRFIPLVKNAAYGLLLNHRSAEIRELAADSDQAVELAVVTDANGVKAYFVFQLSKQADGDLKNCWMTDGVLRVQPPDAPAKPHQRPPEGQLPA